MARGPRKLRVAFDGAGLTQFGGVATVFGCMVHVYPFETSPDKLASGWQTVKENAQNAQSLTAD